MPTTITRGAAAATSFGFTNTGTAPPANGFTLNINGGGTTSFQNVCSDDYNNIWVLGSDPTNNKKILGQFNSAAVSQKSFDNVNANTFSSLAYYNKTVYWGLSNNILYFPTTISNVTQSVPSYTYTDFQLFNLNLYIDAIGYIYLLGQDRIAKLGVNFTTSLYYYTASNFSTYNLINGNTSISSDGTAHFIWNNTSPSTQMAALSVNNSGTVYNNYLYSATSGSGNGYRTSDAAGNTYTSYIVQFTTYYVIAQNPSGTVLWSKTYTLPSPAATSSCPMVVDNQNLYITAGNTSSSRIFAVSASTGLLVWARQYTLLNNQNTPSRAAFLNSNPTFGSGFSGTASAVAAPRSTGGAVGTYGSQTVSDYSSSVTVTNGIASSGIVISAGPATLTSNSAFTPTAGPSVSITSPAVTPIGATVIPA